ncbi:MAG: hypothetical protein AB1921_06025 [Thermodesulfobacteriota bacterium]
MKSIFSLLLLLLLAFSGYHLTFRRWKLPVFARHFYLTGTEFLFLGIFLGEGFTGILDSPTLDQLAPVEALVLGLIGLFFGMQLDNRKLARLAPGLRLSSYLTGLVSFCAVAAGGALVLPFILPSAAPLSQGVVLGACACCSSQVGLALARRQALSRQSSLVNLLRTVSSLDGVISLLCYGALFFLPGAITAGSKIAWPGLLSLAGALAGLLLLFLLLIRTGLSYSELTAVFLGVTVFLSGISLLSGFSPLVASFFLGLLLGNTGAHKERLFRLLAPVEKPLYLVLLVLLGARFSPGSWAVLAAAAACFSLRFAGKLSAGALVHFLFPSLRGATPALGLGLIGQGSLGLALLLDFAAGFPGDAAMQTVSVALVMVLLNELAAPEALAFLFRDKPELHTGEDAR